MSDASEAKGELTRFTGANFEGPAHASPYPVSRLAPVHELVDLAREIERADEMVSATTHAKLDEIARQIRALQARAHEVIRAAQVDSALHQAGCSFKRRVGETYHLYRRDTGQLYFSMLAPEEWGDAPHEYVGSYRLEVDRSWSPVDDFSARARLEQIEV